VSAGNLSTTLTTAGLPTVADLVNHTLRSLLWILFWLSLVKEQHLFLLVSWRPGLPRSIPRSGSEPPGWVGRDWGYFSYLLFFLVLRIRRGAGGAKLGDFRLRVRGPEPFQMRRALYGAMTLLQTVCRCRDAAPCHRAAARRPGPPYRASAVCGTEPPSMGSISYWCWPRCMTAACSGRHICRRGDALYDAFNMVPIGTMRWGMRRGVGKKSQIFASEVGTRNPSRCIGLALLCILVGLTPRFATICNPQNH
jgi:hypothetical protein